MATSRIAAGCAPWMVWGLFGMVVVLSVINLYMGWVIADQMQEIRTLYESRFLR